MTSKVLVMLRSGKEFMLNLSNEQIEELMQHKDIGPRRVFVIGPTKDKASVEIPWNSMFPGTARKIKAALVGKTKTIDAVAPIGEVLPDSNGSSVIYDKKRELQAIRQSF